MASMKDKREAILEATLDLISVYGFHGTPMSKIASHAGVSAGIIYHYFENKEALIDELYRVIKAEYVAALKDGLNLQAPIREQFRRVGRNTIEYCMHHPKKTAFMEQYARSPFYNPAIEAESYTLFEPLIHFIQRAKQEQIIKDLPEQVIYTFTMELASALAQKHAIGLIVMDDALIEQVIDACWDALRR